ncbi:MAG: response regulator [Desulfovibrio sp.]|nr:response regulator [Desulfovibrio sp.]
MNVPFLVTGYMAKNLTQSMIMQEKEAKLLSLCKVLASRLEDGGYDAILARDHARDANREEKIRILNTALKEATDDVGNSAPGLGVGFYSKALDAIITYGPSEQFGYAVGRSIPLGHPGRTVMRTNRAMVRSGTMVRGDIMNAMSPVERHGEVIGYIWANELTTDITAQMSALSRNIALIMGLFFVLTVGLLLLLSRRTVRNVDRIITGVRAMRADLSKRIEGSTGELGEVAASINAMAEDINRANAETNRAVRVLQSVMSNVDSTIYVCDPESMELVYVNETLADLIGRGDLQGGKCHEVLQGLRERCPFCPHKQLFDHEGNPAFTPIRWETHFANIGRDFLVTDRLITWPDGRLLHMQVGTDITERNALAMAEAANLAQRNFLAHMSHEIRTPMNGVLGMTHLAIQADPPPAQMEYLKKIQASASLLLGIINDILDFSRIEAGKMAIEKHAFNLREMVENIRELILPRIRGNNLDLLIDVDPSVPEYVEGDELRLSQVLLNLMGNASKFTLQGSVRLKMRADSLSSGVIRLHCSVEDSGIGMTVEQQKGLFKPFSQADTSTSREFGGTGLGLSISKALVELMDGSIGVSSEQGKGSVFFFDILLRQAHEQDLAAPKQIQNWEQARYDGYRFLLVEDNAINQEIATAILEDLGAAVDTADNGEKGVQAFMQKEYDLILMDVRMPVLDGLEAAKHIRASGKRDAETVPIIAMTANAMQEDREASKEAGMNGHVAKPIDMTELKSVLYQQLHG